MKQQQNKTKHITVHLKALLKLLSGSTQTPHSEVSLRVILSTSNKNIKRQWGTVCVLVSDRKRELWALVCMHAGREEGALLAAIK